MWMTFVIQTFILVLFISKIAVAEWLIPHDERKHWIIDEYPNKPCRLEDGLYKCKNKKNIDICSQRSWADHYCMNNPMLTCTDDEIYTNFACLSRTDAYFEIPNIYLPCHQDEFRCQIVQKCIPRNWVQNGRDDCSDPSFNFPDINELTDESDETISLETCNHETEFSCHGNQSSRRCLPRRLVMDGKVDCPSGEDETKPLTCLSNTEFKCAKSNVCILRRYVNEGFNDCTNGEDENVTDFECNNLEFACTDKRCIPRHWVRNGVEDCSGGEDEIAVLSDCNEGEFGCLDQLRCLPIKYLCDGVQNCRDGSDEVELCSAPVMYHLSNTLIIPWAVYLFKTMDEIIYLYPTFEPIYDLVFGFKCMVTKIVNKVRIASNNLRAVPQFYIQNNISVCYNGEDVCFDADGLFTCTRCLDGTIISKSQLCDGHIDCRDLSDECPCEGADLDNLCREISTGFDFNLICNGTVEMEGGIDEEFCEFGVINFSDSNIKSNLTRPGNFTCTLTNSSSVLNPADLYCNGRIDCVSMEDECVSDCIMDRIRHANSVDELLAITNLCYPFLEQVDPDDTFHEYVGAFAQFKIYISGGETYLTTTDQHNHTEGSICMYDLSKFIWNGINSIFVEPIDQHDSNQSHIHGISPVNSDGVECPLTGFHNSLHFLCDIKGVDCPWMYVCGPVHSKRIEITSKCDYSNDCGDYSDEMNCPEATHFYCKKGEPLFIPREKVTDGRSDCSHRSDECRETKFASTAQLLKSDFLRVYIWVCALAIILSNGAVILNHLSQLNTVDISIITYCNTYLLMNLALSDVIFGFSLLMVGVKSVQFSGRYCQFDLEWRSSLTCNTIGILTVISSQTSINILSSMTAIRWYVTCRPFMANRISLKLIRLLSALSWIVSTMIATYPIWGGPHFADLIYIEPSPYFVDHIVNRSHIEEYITRTEQIYSLGNSSYTSRGDVDVITYLYGWYFTTDDARSRFPHRSVQVKAGFGYYSASSVCFPDLYSQTSPSSEYSLVIVLYNLALLCFIAIGYCSIFFHARTSKKAIRTVPDQTNQKMMKRVVLIVFTDIACWLPIIAMSIHNYRGYELPDFVHPLSAVVFLPINSLINPIIYARLDTVIKRHLSRLFMPIFRRGRSARDTADTNNVEMVQLQAKPLYDRC